jgi:RHS repeat-associated protein
VTTLGSCSLRKIEVANTKFTWFWFTLLCGIALICASNAAAQVITGFPPFGTFDGAPDEVNLGNLNVYWSFPVLAKTGRIPFNYAVKYDSSFWNKKYDFTGGSGYFWDSNDVTGFGLQTYAPASVTGYALYNWSEIICPDNTVSGQYADWVYVDATGTPHPFPLDFEVDGCGNQHLTATGQPDDSSGIKMTTWIAVADGSIHATVYPTTGGSITPPLDYPDAGNFQAQDSNGNYISAVVSGFSGSQTTFTDTLGTTVMTVSPVDPYTAGSPLTYMYAAPGGNASVTVSYVSYNVRTTFCVGSPWYTRDFYQANIYLPDRITYPDASYFQFTYEATPQPLTGCNSPAPNPGDVTGRIASVKLPTGGLVTYNYHYNNGYNGIWSDGSTAGFDRVVNDGTSSNTWRYDTSDPTGSSGTHVTTLTDPAGNQTVYNFTNSYETQRQVYQGSSSAGTLLETVMTCWNGVSLGTCGPGATVTTPIQNKITYTELPGTGSRHDDYFDGNGSKIRVDDYDWGYAYLGNTQTTYATNLGNIVDHPASVIRYDAAGNMVAQTNYFYDQWPLWTPPGTTPQHVAVSDPRGNLTEMQIWTGSTWLYHNMDYYDTGMVHDDRDVNGAPTYFNYADATSTCGNAFPTSVTPSTGTSGVDLTTYTTWDCNGGVATSTRDANNRTVATTGWDPNFWRPTAFTDQSIGGTQLFAYTPTTRDTHWGLNTVSTVHTKTTLDGLGRPHISQREQGYNSPNFDSVETQYKLDAQPYPTTTTTTTYVGTASQGYCSSHGLPSNCTPPGTTTSYDALGRPVHVQDAGGGTADYNYDDNDVLITTGPPPNRQMQYEYDALGRLTSVCELTSAANGGVTCGQSRQQTGYWTRYQYDALGNLTAVCQNTTVALGTDCVQYPSAGQQTRSFTFDALGRMLSETNPENGTTTYAYDTDNFCPQTPGDLARRTDATGAFTCYGFDALHRLWGVSHWSSGHAPNGVSRLYYYDAATVNGIAMSNVKGRLARAVTCTSCANPLTPITELGFSYSLRGETTDTWESTQHSGGYYHSTATYWSHGPMQNLNFYDANSTPLLPTITYGASDGSGLDGEGRITKVTASSGQNPVLSVGYNNDGQSTQPIGALNGVQFGSLDIDHFLYDPSTGRMTKYVFNMGVRPLYTDSGQLTWNANGTLQTLQTFDNFRGAVDSQTCNYTYDDLGRIATTTCNTPQNLPLWIQNFTYDPFGNINKTSGNSSNQSFLPGAYPTSNRVPASYGFVYDNGVSAGVGNVTSDNLGNSYSWDADNRMSSVTSGGNTVNITYDALGRMAEQQRGVNYTQIVYGPDGGKLALMNGQTPTKAFVHLPGGATAVYGPNPWTPPQLILQYYRHPDYLGNSRLATTPSRILYYAGAYAPFGEPYAESGTTDRSFTGQNQDTVFGLYDFMYREHSPNQGRWMSPDPAGLGAVDPMNPQSWNRYAYVLNSPLNLTDPLGLRCIYNQSDGNVIDDGQSPLCDHMSGGPGIGVTTNGNGHGDDDTVDAEASWFLSQLYNTDTNAHAVVAWLEEQRRKFAEEQRQKEIERQDRLKWWKDYGKALIHPDNTIKLTGFAGCIENNRLDNAVQSLGEAYGHPTIGKVASYATLGGTGAAIGNVGADFALGAKVPGLLGRSAHSSTWLRAIGYRTAGRVVSGTAAVIIIGEGVYDATAMVRCAITE